MKFPLDLREQDELMYARGWNDAEVVEREKCASLVGVLKDQPPFNNHPMAKMALSTAAIAIRRGRHLTAKEKLDNLIRNFEEEGDHEVAELIRQRMGRS